MHNALAVRDALHHPETSGRLAVRTNRTPRPKFNEHEVAAYRLWCREADAREQLRHADHNSKLTRMVGGRGGKVLTDNGWVIPNGPLNPRVIDQDTPPMTTREVMKERQVQLEVAEAADNHEYAVRTADMWNFAKLYRGWGLDIRFYFESING